MNNAIDSLAHGPAKSRRERAYAAPFTTEIRMSSSKDRYDVAIVGASIAGCSAAILFSRQGLRVALIERNPDINAYKRFCTHFILASAVPTIQRLGLAERIERAGAIRNGAEFWTQWGWIRPPHSLESPRPQGYSIRREKLDPILREMAVNSPGVEYLSGVAARSLITENGCVTGVTLESASGAVRELGARLIVGADGRNSVVGRLSSLPQSVKPNNRLAFYAYFRDLPLVTGKVSNVWFLGADAAYAFPNDNGITLLAFMPHKQRLADFKRDLEGNFYRAFRSLPDAPDVNPAYRVSSFFRMLDLPNTSRKPFAPGLALIGDAAMSSDPLWGVGCGWAFQSAEWLVQHAAEPLKSGDPSSLHRALQRYAKAHHSALSGHQSVICDFSSRKDFTMLERLFFSAAVHDPVTARHFERFGHRLMSVGEFLHPRAILRAMLKHQG
jgi:2-polyprenyl-6-methoxyphenol hydroxylase-like FAD-dependent oxidoreductase